MIWWVAIVALVTDGSFVPDQAYAFRAFTSEQSCQSFVTQQYPFLIETDDPDYYLYVLCQETDSIGDIPKEIDL